MQASNEVPLDQGVQERCHELTHEFGETGTNIIVTFGDTVIIGRDAEQVVEQIKESVGLKGMGICPFMDRMSVRLMQSGILTRVRTDDPEVFLSDLHSVDFLQVESIN